MKRILLSVALTATALWATGQSVRPTGLTSLRMYQDNPAERYQEPAMQTENTVLLSEEFGSGLNGWQSLGFKTSNNTAVSDTTGVWEYRGTTTVPPRATGSRGAFGSAAPLASPSTANGFMIFDSDWLDNTGSSTGFGTGVFPSPHRGMLVSPTINFTGVTAGTMEFYQYYRRFAGPGGSQTVPATYILVSTNGGTTWSDTITLNADVAVNSATANPARVKLRLPASVANSANVRVAFLFNGDYYVWMIDDVIVRQAPNNDMQVTSTRFLPDTANGRTLEYGQIPLSNTTPIFYQARVRNFGGLAQTNVRINVTVADTVGNTLFTGSSAPLASLAPNTDSLLSVTTPYNATDKRYTRVTFTAVSDSTDFDLTDNTRIRQQSINDSIFGLDVVLAERQGTIGTGSGFANSTSMKFANLLEITTQDTITSATVRLASTTQAGSSFFFTVRTPLANGNPGDAAEIICESDVYTVTAQDVTRGFVTIPIPVDLAGLQQDRILEPGDYWFVIDLFSTPTARIMLLDDQTVTMPTFATLMFTDQWFNNGNAVRFRANFGITPIGGSVNEVRSDLKIKAYPNPARDFILLDLTANDNLGKVSYQITDVTGRIVRSESTMIVGTADQLQIDLNGIQNGVYSIVVNTSKGYNTSRFVVSK